MASRLMRLACVAAVLVGGACSGPSSGAETAAAQAAAAAAAGTPGTLAGKALMTPADVLSVADDFISDRYADDETFALERFAKRRAEYDPRRRCWWVRYNRHPNRFPADNFAVRIDDATGEPTFFGGA